MYFLLFVIFGFFQENAFAAVEIFVGVCYILV